jgi:phospholipid-binding lipoprotein MlaA
MQRRHLPRELCVIGFVAFSLIAGACAGSSPLDPDASQMTVDNTNAQQNYLIAVSDPLEGLNRTIYKFNAQADRYVLLPIVRGYEFVMPLVLRDRISDFFANLDDLISFANLVLQLKFAEAGRTALRFGANSLLGMFGMVDIATAMGMPKYQEDFGKTLGYWGLGGGPYLVLPILGPSNARDTAGKATDTLAFTLIDPFGASSIQSRYPPIAAVNAINSRYVQSFRYFESGSPFEYDLVRYLYTKKRQVEIGHVEPEEDSKDTLGADVGD